MNIINDLEKRIWAAELVPIKAHPEIPKCWHHYLNTKLALIKYSPFNSDVSKEEDVNFLRALGTMAKIYKVDKFPKIYEYYSMRYEEATTYQERLMWDCH